MRSILLSSVFILATVLAETTTFQTTFRQQVTSLMMRRDIMLNTTLTMLNSVRSPLFVGQDGVQKGLQTYQIFNKIDENQDGSLEQGEISGYFNKIGMNHSQRDIDDIYA
jgi:hypothetical protein